MLVTLSMQKMYSFRPSSGGYLSHTQNRRLGIIVIVLPISIGNRFIFWIRARWGFEGFQLGLIFICND